MDGNGGSRLSSAAVMSLAIASKAAVTEASLVMSASYVLTRASGFSPKVAASRLSRRDASNGAYSSATCAPEACKSFAVDDPRPPVVVRERMHQPRLNTL
jgi:hypothetical protein